VGPAHLIVAGVLMYHLSPPKLRSACKSCHWGLVTPTRGSRYAQPMIFPEAQPASDPSGTQQRGSSLRVRIPGGTLSQPCFKPMSECRRRQAAAQSGSRGRGRENIGSGGVLSDVHICECAEHSSLSACASRSAAGVRAVRDRRARQLAGMGGRAPAVTLRTADRMKGDATPHILPSASKLIRTGVAQGSACPFSSRPPSKHPKNAMLG
jgi:hypothetical protein